MDNTELDGVKFSEFPSQTPVNADEVVGLHSGDNARFSIANIVAAIRQGLASIFVPLTRTINGKGLSSDITLDASDVGAVPTSAVGAADGVASLDSNGKVPGTQLDLSGKQSTITASGILKGDGAGGVSAAVAGTDYQAPLTFDATPTVSSTNPVQSGGVYTDVRTRVPVNGMGKNLLDNWYFLNPVNQRGQTSGAAGYSIDRWTASYGSGGVSWSLTSSGLTFQPTNPSSYGYICQVIDNEILSALTGKKISVYVLTSDGDMIGGLVPYAANVLIYDSTYDGHRVRIRFSGSEFRIESFASALTVCAVKLELGSDQTLAHQENSAWVLNEIPDYEEELIKCQTSTADSYDTYANKSLATEQQLAITQVGPKANRAYAANSYFCWNGLLYRVTTAISSGADLTINTNCVQTTVMDEIIRLT